MKQLSALTCIQLTLAFLWIYQGLVPKLLFINADEIAVWQWFGLSYQHAIWAGQAAGVGEIFFGLLFLFSRHRYLHYINIAALIGLFILISLLIPETLIRAFNPVAMNLSMLSLSFVFLSLIQQSSLEFSVQEKE
jgi:hypothetical protein